MKKLYLYENDKVVEKSTLLGDVKDIEITDKDFFENLDGRVFFLSHLDKIGDDLALRFFTKEEDQLSDFAFAIIQTKEVAESEDVDLIRKLSLNKENRLYFKEEDGKWNLLEGDYDNYPFEKMYGEYRHEKLDGVNINHDEVMETIIKDFGQKDAINNLEDEETDFGLKYLKVFGDHTGEIIPYIHAHIETFFAMKQFKLRRFPKEYFSLGFKTTMSEFLKTERLIKLYATEDYNVNTSFEDVLPKGIAVENIYGIVRRSDYKKGGLRSFASAFELALSNILVIYASFANKDMALKLIEEKSVEMLEIGFDYEDFYFHFIADENAYLAALLLDYLKDANQIDIAFNNTIRTAINAVKNHTDKKYSSYALELFDYHFHLGKDLPETKNPDILIKKIFPIDLEAKLEKIRKTL